MFAKSRRPFQFRLRTALLAMSVCCVVCLPLGYFVRSLQRPQEQFVPVSGVVTLNGQPLADAHVQFVSDAPTRGSAAGTTDATGRFNITTYVNPTRIIAGAEPGEYTVVIYEVTTLHGPGVRTATGWIGANPPADIEQEPLAVTRKPLMPERPKKWGLRATVTEYGSNSLNFGLTRD